METEQIETDEKVDPAEAWSEASPWTPELTPVQKCRHEAKEAIAEASRVLVGQPGLSLSEQSERLQKASDLLAKADEALARAQVIVSDRGTTLVE